MLDLFDCSLVSIFTNQPIVNLCHIATIYRLLLFNISALQGLKFGETD